MDVLPVEGGDEGGLETAGDLAVDLVAAVLEGLDLGDPLLDPVVRLEHLHQAPGGLEEVLALGDEELVEAGVAGQEAEGHRSISNRWAGFIVSRRS